MAGGGAYYFAKQSINADRAARYNEERTKQERLRRIEASMPFSDAPSTKHKKKKVSDADHDPESHSSKGMDHAGSPSSEASEDAAPVGHAADEAPVTQKSKYEAEKPYRSRKGDRFS